MHSLITPQSKKLIEAISHAGGEARFVGGCVRDSLIGKAVNDIDLATNLTPDKTTKALEAVGMTVIPTGIDHGTVTVIVDGEKYEVTTLRLDSETDGRHAIVEFTDDWQADAARRDFTYNALYMDASGKIYDYFDGQKDLKNGDTVFIGNAEDRINEDYLRILRFFRFRGRYKIDKQPGYDPNVLEVIKKLSPNLLKLSYERIWAEVQKILLLDEPYYELLSIPLEHLLPGYDSDHDNFIYHRLFQLAKIEDRVHDRNPIRRLAICFPDNFTDIEQFAEKWKFSRKETETLCNVFNKEIGDFLSVKAKQEPNKNDLDAACYKFGQDAVRDFLIVFAAKHEKVWLKTFKNIENYQCKKFPLSGKDLLELGVTPGKQMGEILRKIEAWWLSQFMQPNHDACVDLAKKWLTI